MQLNPFHTVLNTLVILERHQLSILVSSQGPVWRSPTIVIALIFLAIAAACLLLSPYSPHFSMHWCSAMKGVHKLSNGIGLEKVNPEQPLLMMMVRCEFFQRRSSSLEMTCRHVWMTLNTMSCCPHHCSASFFAPLKWGVPPKMQPPSTFPPLVSFSAFCRLIASLVRAAPLKTGSEFISMGSHANFNEDKRA